MHRLHSALTVAVAIKEGRSVQLRALLKSLQPVKPNNQDTSSGGFNNSSCDNRLETSDLAVFANHKASMGEDVKTDLAAGERNFDDNGSTWPDITSDTPETNFIPWGTNNTPPGGRVIISGRNGDDEPAGPNLPNDGGALISETHGQARNITSSDSFISDNEIMLTEDNPIPVSRVMSLKGMNNNPEPNDINQTFNFDASETTLFITAVLLPSQIYCNETLPATLVFATTFVGNLHGHLDDLIKTNRYALCEMLKHCADFPEEREVSDPELINYIKRHSQRSAFHSRYSCITKEDVKREKELRMEIEDYLDKVNENVFLNRHDPRTVKTLIQRHIKAQGDKFRWAEKPATDSVYEMLTKKRLIIIPVLLALIIFFTVVFTRLDSLGWLFASVLAIGVLILITLATLVVLFIILFFIAWPSKNPVAERPPDSHVRKVAATQLRPIINEMTAAAPLKKGWLRRHFYSFALRIINLGCHQLMNIPTVSSIRWLSIDNKKRLLFLSNYSNTTDFYVREFLTGSTPKGVNFMFTNGSGFPDAILLRWGGIKNNPEGYMNVIHTHQHAADLWYAHDYDLMIDEILRNRKIRNQLFKKTSQKDTTLWLQMF
jgi:hypothetical protein